MPNRPDAPGTHATRPASARARRAGIRSFRDLVVPLAAGDHAAIAPLRHLARSTLSLWGITTEQADDVLLVLSELATNALLHTDGPAQIHLHPRAGELILDVADTGTRLPDLDAAPDDDAEHGYGLTQIALVLADAVTITPYPRCGKMITATFAVTHHAD